MITVLARSTPERLAPRVEPRGVGARLGAHDNARSVWRVDDLAAGSHFVGEGQLEVMIERTDHGNAATLALAISNRGGEPLFVESIWLGLRWCGHGTLSHRFLRHGWQSWSFTGFAQLDDTGEPTFPSGPWLRGMYHCVGAPAAERAGWHESETVALVGAPHGGPCCLVGVLETGSAFGIVYLRSLPAQPEETEREVEIDVELRVERSLAPGERLALESVRIAVGTDVNALLERFATLWGRVGGARTSAPFQTGWCSWYHYFHNVSEDDMLRNLDALVANRASIPIDVVQLDDGYQRSIGDWLQTNDKFPRGLAPIAEAIGKAGFTPGLWTAPFAASAESEVLRAHPDWALRTEGGWLRGIFNPEWSADGWVYALDPSHPGFVAHLENTFRSLVALGFVYQKLDFLYMAAMSGQAANSSLTRAARLRAGLEAIRRGVGDDTFLLGCGCPLGPAVGVVDGMRIGPDVAPSWRAAEPRPIPGIERMLPSTESALRSICARLFMHRRLWLNDPDCLMARSRETALRPDEARSLAAAIAVSGGMMVMSDDVTLLEADERAMVSRVIKIGRSIDGAGAGACRTLDPLSTDLIRHLQAAVGPDIWRAAINMGDVAGRVAPEWSAGRSGQIEPFPEISGDAGALEAELLSPHASRASAHPGLRSLAVFCDFDGTMSVRDVGSSLAREYLQNRRDDLFGRFLAGEIDPWQYAEALFEGFAFGPDVLDAFLTGIDLDPGAHALVDWCAAQGVPLRILSDGFDYNLERLQALHGIRFRQTSNHLRFEGDLWRIAPGNRNPLCDCGTGCCKRSIIEAHRAAHPDDCIVHIGNGRVSDRCGAEVADSVFAKDTLAPELDARGVAYQPFETLLDVVAVLQTRWGGHTRAPGV